MNTPRDPTGNGMLPLAERATRASGRRQPGRRRSTGGECSMLSVERTGSGRGRLSSFVSYWLGAPCLKGAPIHEVFQSF